MNGEDRKFLGRIEQKIADMHEDIKELKRWNVSLQKGQNDIKTATALNTKFAEEHMELHKGYFLKAIAVIGTVTGVFTFGWKVIADLLLKLSKP